AGDAVHEHRRDRAPRDRRLGMADLYDCLHEWIGVRGVFNCVSGWADRCGGVEPIVRSVVQGGDMSDAFGIDYVPRAEADIRAMRVFDRGKILEAIGRHLRY